MIVRVPFRVPKAVGVKVTWTAQLRQRLTTVEQLLDAMAKSPLIVTFETVRLFVPRSNIVVVCAALVLPTTVEGNTCSAGAKAAAAPAEGEIFLMNPDWLLQCIQLASEK